MDYFTLFHLPEDYDIDLVQLGLCYQKLQRTYHPDRFASGSETERLHAVQQAAMINDAYQTLKNPLRRAEYILSQQGVDLLSEQHAMRDTEFLMEQMELREQLETIEQQNDSRQLTQFNQGVNRINHALFQQLSQQLHDQQWTSAITTVQKLQFLRKLLQQIEYIEDKMFDGM